VLEHEPDDPSEFPRAKHATRLCITDHPNIMRTVLVTGARGFIGKHLVEALRRNVELRVIEINRESSVEVLRKGLFEADVVYHLAGVNRPKDPVEFTEGNTRFTELICSTLTALGQTPLVVISSSIQAELVNPYGLSKREAEIALECWARDTGGSVAVLRLKNVFGKWCRPNYNSVTATFCHNVAHNLPLQISDPAREIDLVYIDDVVQAFCSLDESSVAKGTTVFREVTQSHKICLGDLAEAIQSFRRSRETLELPSFVDEFTRRLYATYLSYLDGDQFSYALEQKSDARGSLSEFIKQPHFGQVFVSRTKPGVTRGNHYHHTKTEKFFVVEGDAVIRFRPIAGGDIIEHRVSGKEFKVVDIPPGYAHSIENIGLTELITLFWASEIFDPQKPDVYFRNVL
jgi:UDP-2-acetamido-2,6-beta-L-arabino-hexul-4-ose reductase